MTRKDYIAIAEVIKLAKHRRDPNGEKTREHIGYELVALFTADNPRFDRDRFLIAAGLPRN